MIENQSTKCRFMLKTSDLGVSSGELSCLQCTREPTSLQNSSSDLPVIQEGGLLQLPFSIFHDEEETSNERGQAAAASLPLTVRSKAFFRMQFFYFIIHLGPAEQISNEQSVDTASAPPSRPEKVGTIDGDKQDMGQGAKKKNKSFLSRIFRRK